ncbi:aldo/keto reductase family protein [Ochrobactrum quorumnocens]|uniref:Aldo/keto reductase family protein n=1 Tax=Ochrobactrum quorumnocens TaxID=271865 RepID=A0A248UDX8_9HYPH|nr:aldo/keto reductase [[Ochrobactrum] quorumnocens]ASV84888.1 aldo/keto reductase family protein [[Ochrobactrum] quorumnocens]
MMYSALGQTGVFVSRLCLGTMTFGGSFDSSNGIAGVDKSQADRIVGRALESGINFVDTADVYTGGQSEEILGEILGPRRRNLVLATKVHVRSGPGPNDVGLSRIHIMQSLEESLKRLQTDYIDLYQIHRWDRLTPIAETLRALDDAVRQGKVRYIGASNLAAWQLMKSLGVSDKEGLTRFCTVQAYYSLVGRGVEDELVPAMLDQGVGMMCWSPLGGGLLSGRALSGPVAGTRRGKRGAVNQFPPVDEGKALQIIAALQQMADRYEASVPQVALAWLLSRPAVASVIVGARAVEQLNENLGSLEITLEPDDVALLESLSAEPVRYPAWMSTFDLARRFPDDSHYAGPSWTAGQDPLPDR